jgi:hypothetical protein
MEHPLSTALGRRCGSAMVHRPAEPLYINSSRSCISSLLLILLTQHTQFPNSYLYIINIIIRYNLKERLI